MIAYSYDDLVDNVSGEEFLEIANTVGFIRKVEIRKTILILRKESKISINYYLKKKDIIEFV